MPETHVSYEHEPTPGYGWSSSFPEFRQTPPRTIREALADFVVDASPQQVAAWDESIPPLQAEVGHVLSREAVARSYSTILEYQLPLEFRRPDVVVLAGDSVFVLELKSKSAPLRADIDQVAAYKRDLIGYHRACEDRPVHAALVLTRASGRIGEDAGVHLVGLDAVDDLVERLSDPTRPAVLANDFVSPDAYRPLPTLVQAARELFERGDLRYIKRARTATEPAFDAIRSIVEDAARTHTRRLVLLSGVPGAGKTLVGLQVAHARFLDDLALARDAGRPSAPAVFLSGNGPLVEVLQYELRGGGGGGKTFVRGVKEYVQQYTRNPRLIPPEHVLIFDEAQRAWDAKKVESKHALNGYGRSEPEHFIEFAERIPGWCVVIGLIGTGQEIHDGEEGGVIQWRWAVERSTGRAEWLVHGPNGLAEPFDGLAEYRSDDRLHLGIELRFHLAREVDEYVAGLIGERPGLDLAQVARRLEASGYHLRMTRDLDQARDYLRQRYAEDPEARYGIVASSRDRDLVRYGVPNDFQSTKRARFGPWYAEGDDDPYGRSCRALRDCVTEFGAQGLELDAALVAWGTDFVRREGTWDISRARGYAFGSGVRDPFRLRVNAYRVLLTRARDVSVVYLPPIGALDETAAYLADAGFRPLSLT